MGIIIFIPLLAIMYFFMIRPQQQKLKQQRAMLAMLDVGDDIVTESGLYGTVSELDGDTVFLLIADGVEVKISKASIATMIEYSDPSAADDMADADVDDA